VRPGNDWPRWRIWLSDAGTVVVARVDDEYAVLSEFQAVRDDQVVLLDADAVRERVPLGADVVGGAWFPLDVRVDPCAAVPAIARWLAEQGVRFRWGCTVWGVEPGLVTTSRGRCGHARSSWRSGTTWTGTSPNWPTTPA
jgi:glycine/D-amino acid oxidase-like deaminating enzyme